MDYGLKNRVALVTGGSEGIGRATAGLLAAEGSRVAICARRPDVLEAAAEDIRRSTEAEVLAIPTDLRDSDSVDNLIATINDTWGGVDVLVNNAGISSAMPFDQLTDDALLADMQLKLFGWLRTIRGVLPHMKEQRWGRIINMTALAAKAPGAGSYPSSVSRAAGVALTKALSKELAPHNILVNTVLIGLIKAGQHEHRWEANPNGQSLEERYAEMGKNVPLGRVGESEEAANLVTFLASERASFITGVAINMDGGLSPVV